MEDKRAGGRRVSIEARCGCYQECFSCLRPEACGGLVVRSTGAGYKPARGLRARPTWGLSEGAEIGGLEVRSVVQTEQADFFFPDSEGGEAGVHQDACENHGAVVGEIERAGGTDSDRSRAGEDDHIAFEMADAVKGGVNSRDEVRPGFAGVIVAAFDPGSDDFFVAIGPAAMDGMAVLALAFFDGEPHFFVFAAKILIVGG